LWGAPKSFESTLRAHYSNRTVKERNAVAHGAVGTIGLMTPEMERLFPWDWLLPQTRAGRLDWIEAGGAPHDAVAELRGSALLSPAAAGRLFSGAPATLDEVFQAARDGRTKPFPLPVTARIHLVSRHAEFSSPNVVGLLEGSDPALRS